MFDITEDDYGRWRAEADAEEMKRIDQLSQLVLNDHLSGVYEVIDVVDDGGRSSASDG